MNYHNITKDDMLNGSGLRVVLWTAGCEHHCEGCQNPVTWDRNDGLKFDEAAKQEIFEELEKSYIKGLTISGGDPLATYNRSEILALVKEVKEKYPDKDIWSYTGYTFEKLLEDDEAKEILNYIDVLVDGKFVKDLLNVDLPWRGSSNQRVIDVKASSKENVVIIKDKTKTTAPVQQEVTCCCN